MSDPRWNDFLMTVWSMDLDRVSAMLHDTPDLLHIRSGIGETPLHYLAVENHLAGVKWLYEKGASIDTKNEFGTPVIFEVAQLGYRDLASWFLDNGVDLTATDDEGNDIFGYLAEYHKEDMIDFLQSSLSRKEVSE